MINKVYNRNLIRVRYEDCRLPVAAIYSEFNKWYKIVDLKIEEELGDLNFSFVGFSRVGNLNGVMFPRLCKMYNIESLNIEGVMPVVVNALGGNTRNGSVYTVKFILKDYKKIDSNLIRSIKGLKKFSL